MNADRRHVSSLRRLWSNVQHYRTALALELLGCLPASRISVENRMAVGLSVGIAVLRRLSASPLTSRSKLQRLPCEF